MDKWKAKEIKIMELGGNKKAHAFYSKNNMFMEGTPHHENPALSKYKMSLQKKALAELEAQGVQSKDTPEKEKTETTPQEEDKKEEDNFFESLKSTTKPASNVVNSDQASSSIYSFSNLKQSNKPANLNAKKLDIDFGGEDFFDSFGMSDNNGSKPQESSNENPFGLAEVANEESGPFQLGSGVSTHTKTDNDDFVKNKLKDLEGK